MSVFHSSSVRHAGLYGSNPGGLEPLVRAVAKPCAWALSALDTGSESLSWRAIDWDFWSVTPLEQNLLFGRSVLDIGWWQAEEDWSFLSYRNLFSRVGGNFNSEAVAGIQFLQILIGQPQFHENLHGFVDTVLTFC